VPYTLPYAPQQIYQPNGRLVDLIRAQGEDAARSAERRGQLSAQLWSGVGNSINQGAQSVLQATDPKRQMESLQLNEAKSGIAEHNTFKKILKDTPPVNENGMQLYDLPALASKATAAGIDPSAYLEHYANVNNGFRNEYQARMSTVQAGAQGLMLAPDPELAKDFLQRLEANHTISSQVHDHLSGLIDSDPTPANIVKLVTPFAGPQKPMMGKPGDTPLNPITAQPMGAALPDKPVVVPAGGTLVGQPPANGQPPAAPQALFSSPPAPSTAGNEAAIRALYAKREGGEPLTPQETAAIKGYEIEKSFNDAPVTVKTMENGKPVEKVMTRAQALAAGQFPSQPPASMTINPSLVPSGDALDMAAKRYLATGDLPSMGMGQAGAAARVAVMNAAAKIDPQASLAANKAAYKADAANLTKLQTTEGTLSAFEKTAGKNLDQFLSLADKIPDTGVPWLNQPLRSVNDKALGSADQAAFNAARDVALREIARVTNDPKLSGSLTDSARAEVSGLSAKDATFAQIKAVAKVLKQDMANVHSGINEQINAVKTGLQGNPAAVTAIPTFRYNPATGKVEPIKPGGD
jgi:hypothetical protein